MDSSTIAAALQDSIPEAAVEVVPAIDAHTTLCISRDYLLPLARALREREDLRFGLLVELTAVDYLPREPRFEVVYTLVSLDLGLRLRVKVRLAADDARLSTVSTVWPAANWLEREVFDLFGIVFDGHPDLRRLLMPEDWEGHPLRKDYPVQIRMRPRTTEALQVTEEEFRTNLERDRRVRS